MARDNKKRPVIRVKPISTFCEFCKSETAPDYKEPGRLAKYLSDRAKIYSKERTGLCAKHQRALSRAVKRARVLGSLQYFPGV